MATGFLSAQKPPSLSTHQRDERADSRRRIPVPTENHQDLARLRLLFLGRSVACNAAPHFVHGISGDRFPTPCAKPLGKAGHRPPERGVVLFNLVLGYILFGLGKVASGGDPALLGFFGGVTVISIGMSMRLAHKHRDNQ